MEKLFKPYRPLTVSVYYVEKTEKYTYNCWMASLLGWGAGEFVWSDTAEGALRKAQKNWGNELKHASDCECPECQP